MEDTLMEVWIWGTSLMFLFVVLPVFVWTRRDLEYDNRYGRLADQRMGDPDADRAAVWAVLAALLWPLLPFYGVLLIWRECRTSDREYKYPNNLDMREECGPRAGKRIIAQREAIRRGAEFHCSRCRKSFMTDDGLRQHTLAKHEAT